MSPLGQLQSLAYEWLGCSPGEAEMSDENSGKTKQTNKKKEKGGKKENSGNIMAIALMTCPHSLVG